MGGRSSKFVKRFEYHAHLQQIQDLLEEMKQRQQTEIEELNSNYRKMQLEINTLLTSQQNHAKSLNTMEQQYNKKNKKLSDKLDEFHVTLAKYSSEQEENHKKLPSHIKTEVELEQKKWTNNVIELKERFEEIKSFSMELISMDLAHEREIKDLKMKINYLEEKVTHGKSKPETPLFLEDLPIALEEGSASEKPCQINATESYNFYGKEKSSKSQDYDLKFSKINMAIKKLKENIQIS